VDPEKKTPAWDEARGRGTTARRFVMLGSKR
jgi:hypothetical protein